jgi:hypothetical protein
MPHSSKKRGHFRKKPDVVHIPPLKVRKEKSMEKTPEKEPHGPPPPPPKPGDKPADEPKPGRPPHWHEGDPEPEDEEAKHLPPKNEK